MRSTVLFAAGFSALLSACPSPPQAPRATNGDPNIVALAHAPDSEKVDRMGAVDGALTPDGTMDVSYAVEVEGPIKAIFLISAAENGAPTGAYQADTLIASDVAPLELGAVEGGGTSGVAVVEGGKLLNRPDGSLEPIGPGTHRLVIYVSPTPTLRAAKWVRVYVLRPDGTLVAGDTLQS